MYANLEFEFIDPYSHAKIGGVRHSQRRKHNWI